MIPPWSEAEQARIAEIDAELATEVGYNGSRAYDARFRVKAGESWVTPDWNSFEVYARQALKAARWLLALRACLARAEQANRLDAMLTRGEAQYQECDAEREALRQRAEQADAKAAALWDRLNDLQQYPGTRTEEP